MLVLGFAGQRILGARGRLRSPTVAHCLHPPLQGDTGIRLVRGVWGERPRTSAARNAANFGFWGLAI